MQEGKVLLSKGYGLANTRTMAPVTPETLFAIGSVTKQFTCAVALQMEEEGKFSFGDRVSRFGAEKIRTTSTARPLDFPPGSRYSYSNTGYPLLGYVTAMAGHKPFSHSLQERLLGPLGLAHTRFEPTRGEPGLAEGYTPIGLGPAEPAIPEGKGWIGAAGGLWSTPGDLMKWDLALVDGKVLKPASWAFMTTPRALTDGRSSAHGCGQSIRDRGPVLVLSHGGGVSGFGARNAFIPATRSAVVVMANADWAAGVLDTIQEAVLAKLMPVADAPKVNGAPATDVALDMLRQIRSGTIDRATLGAEYSAFLTAQRLAVMSKSLIEAGEVSQAEAGPTSERGGLEVSTVRLLVGTTPIRTLMYRAPDGKIEQFLFNRR